MGEEEGPIKIRVPREGEILGEVIGIMGGSRVLVNCSDKKERLCRIPGKIRRFIWVREGDVVVVEPWEIAGDKKGDVKWRYTKVQADWLRKKGYYRD